MIARLVLLPHQLQLTLGAIVIVVDPTLVGRRTFVPLSSLLLYEATNLLLMGLTVVALLLILCRRRAAIPVNLALGGSWLAALVAWQFLGLHSSVGTVIDVIPALLGLGYFLTSSRVRHTLNRTGPRSIERTSWA